MLYQLVSTLFISSIVYVFRRLQHSYILGYTLKNLMNLFAGLFGGFLIKEKGGPKRLIFLNQLSLGLTYYLYCYFVQVVCLYSYFALE